MFETVVVATDGSASVERAVGAAGSLAAAFDADLHALSVVTPETDAVGRGRTSRSEAEAAVERIADAADRTVTTALREGPPETAITSHAEAVEADVVVMGTRGRGGEGFHLGSVAEHVVERCPVPVMTVRSRSDDGG